VKLIGTSVKSYLGGSASVQKRRAKPQGLPGGTQPGRSSNGPSRRGLLSTPDRVAPGPGFGRASRNWAKPIPSDSKRRGIPVADAVSHWRVVLVLHVVMSGKRLVHFTGEVPPCPGPSGRVTSGYKAGPKGQSYARASRTASAWPRSWGYQRRQSSPARRDERQNRKELVGTHEFMGKVSRRVKATKWPDGTSFRQPLCFAKKHPHTLRGGTTGSSTTPADSAVIKP